MSRQRLRCGVQHHIMSVCFWTYNREKSYSLTQKSQQRDFTTWPCYRQIPPSIDARASFRAQGLVYHISGFIPTQHLLVVSDLAFGFASQQGLGWALQPFRLSALTLGHAWARFLVRGKQHISCRDRTCHDPYINSTMTAILSLHFHYVLTSPTATTVRTHQRARRHTAMQGHRQEFERFRPPV